MNDNDKVVMIPFFVAESMADRLSKANKRLWIICILLIILLVGTNAMWIWYESQFMYYEEYINQDVETAFGDDLPMYYFHYVAFGKDEGRSGV